MTILQTTTLSEPVGSNKIPRGTLVYFRARLKQRIYNIVIREFKKSGLSKADLARRLDKGPAQLSRLLSRPGNMTMDTVSDLLFAIKGGELDLSIAYPLASCQPTFPEVKVKPDVVAVTQKSVPLGNQPIDSLLAEWKKQAPQYAPIAA